MKRIKLPPGYQIEVIYPAPLASPAGIALTPSGDFLIAENSIHDIKKVTPDGKVSTIAHVPSASAVAHSPQGEAFVGGNGGIWKLSPEGEPSKFSDVGVSKITFGPDGYLYTINWHGGPHPEIMKISPEGEATVFFTGLSRPSGIAFSPSGELYVADPGAQRIIKVGIDGKITTIINGLYTDPIAIRFDKYGVLYFTGGWVGKFEYGLYKIASDSVSRIVLEPLIKGTCEDIAFDEAGNIFLISTTYGMLYKINPQGKVTILIEAWHNPRGMVVGASGDLYIADNSRSPFAPGRILRLDMKGNVTTSTEGLRSPDDLAFDTSGNLFVADTDGQISRISPQGEKQLFVGPRGPQSIAYDPVSGDFYAFMGKDKIFRINPEGNRTAVRIDFGEEVFQGRVAIDKQGNLFVYVVYVKNQGVGPTFSSLFRITTAGEVKILAKFTDEVPGTILGLAVSPSGDVFLLAHPTLTGEIPFAIRKVTPAGEVSIFAAGLPVDPLGIAINTKGDIFFGSSTGIYRIFLTS